MCRLWMSYRDSFPRLDRYMGEWICDWCLIHRLPPPLEQIAPALPSLPEKVSLKEFYMRYDDNGQCPLDETLLDMLTSYHWQTSKYVTPQNRALFRTHPVSYTHLICICRGNFICAIPVAGPFHGRRTGVGARIYIHTVTDHKRRIESKTKMADNAALIVLLSLIF